MKIIVATLLAFAVSTNSAWAQGKEKPRSGNSAGACVIENRVQIEFFAPQVFVFGDLKVKVQVEKDVDPKTQRGGPNYSVVFDLKAPNYLKRGLEMRVGETFTDTICGSEVSLKLWSSGRFEVSSF